MAPPLGVEKEKASTDVGAFFVGWGRTSARTKNLESSSLFSLMSHDVRRCSDGDLESAFKDTLRGHTVALDLRQVFAGEYEFASFEEDG